MMRWWLKLILGLLAIALLCVLVLRIGSLTLDVLKNGESSGETDPMFAPVDPTQAPMPEGEEGGTVYQDNSANWNQTIHTPVDQNAAELGEEEQNASRPQE